MDNIRRYQHYRVRRDDRTRQRVRRWTIAAAVVAVVVLLWRALVGSGPEGESNENIPPLVNEAVTGNTNTANANVATNGNTNATPAAAGLTVDQCAKDPVTPTTAKKVALTFNAGVSQGQAEQIRDILKQQQATGSFFLPGQWIEQNTDLAKSIAEAGFPVYNLTYDRPNPTEVSAAALTEQLTKAEGIIQQATGKSPKPYFRPPLGAHNQAVVATANQAGYCLILWSVDARDWELEQTAEGAKQRVLDEVKPGAIVLLQVGSGIVPDFLTDLITELKNQGYALVTVADLFT